MSDWNPLYEILQALDEAQDRASRAPIGSDEWSDSLDLYRVRAYAQCDYAWSVPSPEALKPIVELGLPIVDVMAGTGYWAQVLTLNGLDVVAYDRAPCHLLENLWCSPTSWYDVMPALAPDVARLHPDRALMLCWPPYNEPDGAESVRSYHEAGGQTVIYLGEGPFGCTGDPVMHDLLGFDPERRSWIDLSTDVDDDEPPIQAPLFRVDYDEWIPSLPGINDRLHICHRI